MTTRTSNPAYLTVLPSAGTDGVGWTVRALSERDYTSVVADVSWFAALGFTVEANQEGGGTLTLDSEDVVLTGALPAGETARLADQEALWQVLEDGVVRFEFLAEDVDEDVIPDGGGPRQTVIAGRGTASVLEWAPVLPEGMPSPVSMTRNFTAHPMVAWVELFEEAQADGYLEWVTLTFGPEADSEGLPWAGGAQALSVNAGETLLDLLKRWCEANELGWRMLPGFRLDVRQSPGVRHEDEIVFTQYRSQGEHKRKITRRELANAVFADSGDNGLAVAEDTDSVTKWRKRAAWISAGDSADASARSMVANTSLVLSKDQRLSRTVKILPDKAGRHPFVDFDVHDWVTVEVPDDDAESGARKVMGLAVDIDDGGAVDYEATLSSRFEVRAVKIQRLLDKLGGSERSGSGSAASSPIPVSKAVSVVKLSDLSDVDLTAPAAGALLQWNGSRWVDVAANLDLLTDVDTGTIPGSGEVALLYDHVAGLWKPGNTAAGGGFFVSAKHVFPVPILTTSAGSATVGKGQRVMALANVTVTSWAMWITGVAGKTYRLGCWELGSTGLVIASQVGSFVDVASPGAGRQKISSGTVSWNLDAGKHYAFTLHVSDSSTVAAYNAGTLAAGSPGLFLTVPPAQNGSLTFSAVPAVTVAGTSATGSYETEITAQTR